MKRLVISTPQSTMQNTGVFNVGSSWSEVLNITGDDDKVDAVTTVVREALRNGDGFYGEFPESESDTDVLIGPDLLANSLVRVTKIPTPPATK